MKILVTGSRGFVGKKLVSVLRKKGHKVREFDLALGHDLLNGKQCIEACKGIDVVYHFAAVLDEKSRLVWEVNVNGTENILEAAAKARVKQFIYLSTVGVHGSAKGVVKEESPFKPETGYEKSKAEAEKLVHEFHEVMPITVVRSALVLGPNKFWAQIVGLVKKGFPLIGSGKQAWQTIYADDLVQALVFVLGREACLGETFIVAEAERHSLRELYEEIQKQLGMQVEVKTVPVLAARLGAMAKGKGIVSGEHIKRLVRTREYDTGKIEALGWKAKTGMQEAVRKTLAGLEF